MNPINPIFDLKQSIAGIFSTHKAYSRVIAGEKEIFKTEEKIFEKIADIEHDADSVQELRNKNRSNILRLQSALARVDSREESKLDKNFIIEEQTTIKEWREYEKNLRNQVNDIKMIVELLKKIIDAEKYEALFDIETPFDIIEEYFRRLNGILRHRTLNGEAFSGLLNLIGEMKVSYQGLVEVTSKLIDNDSKYFGQDISLDVYFQNRSKLKQQLNGKTQALLAQIQRFEDILVGLAKEHDKQYANAILANPTYYKKKEALSELKKKHDIEFTKALLENVSYFKRQFKELVQFCNDRIQISNRIMVEAAALQLKKNKELVELKENLDELYSKFLAQQLKLQKDFEKKQSAYLSEQVAKRIKEFSDYRNALKNDTKKLDDFIVSIEEEDISDLKKESANISSVKIRIMDWNRKFAATVVLLTGMSVLAPLQMTESSNSLDRETNSRQVMTIAAVGTRNAEKLAPVIPILPEELFAVDADLRKKLIGDMARYNDEIDSTLKSLNMENLDYLKWLAIEWKYVSSGLDPKSDKYRKMFDNHLEKVKKAILLHNPNYSNTPYLRSLIDRYAPGILPSQIPLSFAEGILQSESASKYVFSISPQDARGLYQMMRETWYSIFPTLNFDTFAFVAELNTIAALKYMDELYRTIPKETYAYQDWSDYLKNVNPKFKNLELPKLFAMLICYNWGIENWRSKTENATGNPNQYVPEVVPRGTKKYVFDIFDYMNDSE